jgi:hypothetical protein
MAHRCREWQAVEARDGVQQSELNFVLREINLLYARLTDDPGVASPADEDYLRDLRKWETALTKGSDTDAWLQSLIGPKNTSGGETTHTGLRTLIRARSSTLDDDRLIYHGWKIVCSAWSRTRAEYAELFEIWANMEKQRARQVEREKHLNQSMLRRIAMRCTVGLFGCWIAQWFWWIGFLRVAEDE